MKSTTTLSNIWDATGSSVCSHKSVFFFKSENCFEWFKKKKNASRGNCITLFRGVRNVMLWLNASVFALGWKRALQAQPRWRQRSGLCGSGPGGRSGHREGNVISQQRFIQVPEAGAAALSHSNQQTTSSEMKKKKVFGLNGFITHRIQNCCCVSVSGVSQIIRGNPENNKQDWQPEQKYHGWFQAAE